jgi:TP901 family phage tail tape measure protein
VTDNTGRMRPFMDVLTDVTAKLNQEQDEQKRFVAAQRLFGEQGGLAMLALAAAGRKGFDDMENRVRNGTTTVQEKAEIMGSSFAGMGKRIKSALEVLSIDVAKTFGPDLDRGLRGTLAFVKDVITAFKAINTGGDPAALGGLIRRPSRLPRFAGVDQGVRRRSGSEGTGGAAVADA